MPRFIFALFLFVSATVWDARANIPGSGSGTGANVTLTDSGSTVTLREALLSFET